MGPSAFRIAGMADHLSALGLTVVDKGDIATPIPETKGPGDPRKRYVQRDRQGLPAAVPDRARLVSMKGAVPLVLGGDHSLGAGTGGGIGRVRETKAASRSA